MSEKGNTQNTGENLVALREQHNGMCSVSKLIASCLSSVLRRKKSKRKCGRHTKCKQQTRIL